MIRSVCFICKKTAEERLKATNATAIISITDPNERPARLPKGVPTIRLEFVDIFEEKMRMPVGVFPDRLQPPLAVFYDQYEIPDGHHAERIVNFVSVQAKKEMPIDLVIHCQAGISRSAAVAQFVAERYCVIIEQPNLDTSRANARLLRLLNKAMDGVPFTETAEIDINTVKREPLVYETFSWPADENKILKSTQKTCKP